VVRTGWMLGLVLGLAAPVGAAVSIAPEPRTELLYSSKADVDCTKLFKTASDVLPQNVVRLRALVDGAPADSSMHFAWSFKGQAIGRLAADEDLGPSGTVPLVTAMCANFGNACLLSDGSLDTYAKDTVLYVAPACDEVDRNPAKRFGGGSVKLRVKGFQGKRKLGKAKVTIGFGHNGSATLSVDQKDGIGKPAGVVTGVVAEYEAAIQQPTGVADPPSTYTVSGDLGGGTLAAPCPPYAACNLIEQTGTKGVSVLTAAFPDESALCDNIRVVVGTCSPDAKLDVITDPHRTVYDPANPSQSLVNVSVVLHNRSKAANGLPPCTFLLEGPGTATCEATLTAGDFRDSKTTSFSLPHCSKTPTQTCTSNGDCPAGERCLVIPYCSASTQRDCTSDADCAPPTCPTCDPKEICVRVLQFFNDPFLTVAPGDSITLVSGTVELRNRFTVPAQLKDTWTVNVHVPALTVDKTVKYKIKSRP
jgi:hypothetical protein